MGYLFVICKYGAKKIIKTLLFYFFNAIIEVNYIVNSNELLYLCRQI